MSSSVKVESTNWVSVLLGRGVGLTRENGAGFFEVLRDNDGTAENRL